MFENGTNDHNSVSEILHQHYLPTLTLINIRNEIKLVFCVARQ